MIPILFSHATIVKMNGEEAAISTDSESYRATCVDIPVVDTLGAGDGFGTAFESAGHVGIAPLTS